jgi:hypothetical protein
MHRSLVLVFKNLVGTPSAVCFHYGQQILAVAGGSWFDASKVVKVLKNKG